LATRVQTIKTSPGLFAKGCGGFQGLEEPQKSIEQIRQVERRGYERRKKKKKQDRTLREKPKNYSSSKKCGPMGDQKGICQRLVKNIEKGLMGKSNRGVTSGKRKGFT